MLRNTARGLGSALLLMLAAGTPAALSLAPQPAAAQALSELSCRALWYQRNAVYAEQGHCFKTADAIATFGERCYPPYGKLTPAQQRYVDQVQYWEARKGCR
ncbi:YARHG domain-containing protein [Xanthobacter sediminis]|uniref:YARHG domain-containing protein n=1 Tax=Xanthobacter sediminis TaxID=3119926 RepID=UPI0037280A7B